MPVTPLTFPAQVNLVEFISHHAHDLRSPYNRVLGFSKIILKGQDGPINEMQKEDLTTVYNNSLQAFRAINGLIDISRLLSGEKQIQIGQVALLPLLEQVGIQWKKSFPDKEIQIETQVNTAALAIPADEFHLRQALLSWIACVTECVNLPAQVKLGVEEEPGCLVFTIASQGTPSISPSVLDLETNGYIGQTLITLQGGLFRLQERSNEGATICFTLPRE